jgi:[NiFe] hydrogenase diaphorase moiety large subunit
MNGRRSSRLFTAIAGVKSGGASMTSGAQSGDVTGPAVTVPSIPEDQIVSICESYANDRHRMLDILREVQDRFSWISPKVMETVASQTGLSRIQVEGVASFYSFLSLTPKGRVTIRLCDDIVDRYAGLAEVVAAFEEVLGIRVGETSADRAFSLEYTPCIGMCDQAPAAMINDVVLTRLTADTAREPWPRP